MKDVRVILKNYLLANDYDGLCTDGCGCLIDDLAPCAGDCLDCKPGHRVHYPDRECPCGEGCEWHVAPGRRT